MAASALKAYVEDGDLVFVVDGLEEGKHYYGAYEWKPVKTTQGPGQSGSYSLQPTQVADENGQAVFRASLWNLTHAADPSGTFLLYIVNDGVSAIPRNAVDHVRLEFRYTAPA